MKKTMLQNEFLGGIAAIRIDTAEDFEKFKEWMAMNNLFLENGEPVVKMKCPVLKTSGIARDVNGMAIFWSKINDLISMNYSIHSVNDFFTPDEEPKQEQVIEAEIKVISEETEVTNDMLALQINDKPQGDPIISNIDHIVALIPAIKKKQHLVVTESNYKELTKKGGGIIPTYRKHATELKKQLSSIKKSYLKPYEDFEAKAKDVINALNETADFLSSECDEFENKRRNELKQERLKEIVELKSKMVEEKKISKEYAERFAFDEKWLNVTCSHKKFIEEAQKQLDDLAQKEQIEKQNREFIENTIVNHCQLTGIDEKTVKREKYIMMLNQGINLGDITTSITNDIEMAKKNIQYAVEQERKKRQEAQKMPHEEQKQPAHAQYQEVKKKAHIDQKTGEVYAVSGDNTINVRIQPHQGETGKIYSYTFDFQGDFSSILTLNRFMQALSEVNNTFKFERK